MKLQTENCFINCRNSYKRIFLDITDKVATQTLTLDL